MGWFSGPTIKERNRSGRIEYYGKCEECGKEQSDWDKKSVERELEKCEKEDKREKEKAETKRKKEKREREEREERNAELKRIKERDDLEKQRERELAKQAAVIREKMIKGRNQKRREAKGKCPWCRQQPCAGTKPKCAAAIAAGFESIMNTGDPSDPATFDPQLKFYRDNM